MIIRRAVADDALAVMQVVQAGFETYRSFAPPGWAPPDETRPEQLEKARRELADPAVFARIALDGDGRAVGTVRLVPADTPSRDGTVPDLHLRHLFVVEDHWGTGLARELHAAAVAWMAGTARLFTPAQQARARRFYEREGWSLHDGPFPEPRLGFPIVEYRLTSRSG